MWFVGHISIFHNWDDGNDQNENGLKTLTKSVFMSKIIRERNKISIILLSWEAT